MDKYQTVYIITLPYLVQCIYETIILRHLKTYYLGIVNYHGLDKQETRPCHEILHVD